MYTRIIYFLCYLALATFPISYTLSSEKKMCYIDLELGNSTHFISLRIPELVNYDDLLSKCTTYYKGRNLEGISRSSMLQTTKKVFNQPNITEEDYFAIVGKEEEEPLRMLQPDHNNFEIGHIVIPYKKTSLYVISEEKAKQICMSRCNLKEGMSKYQLKTFFDEVVNPSTSWPKTNNKTTNSTGKASTNSIGVGLVIVYSVLLIISNLYIAYKRSRLHKRKKHRSQPKFVLHIKPEQTFFKEYRIYI